MRRVTQLLLLLSLTACEKEAPVAPAPVDAATPAPAEEKADPYARYTAKQFHETTRVSGGSFSPDETKLLATSDHTGVPNVYEQPVAGGDLIPLTEGDGVAKYAVSYFPQDERFLYSADGGGDELSHLFVGEKGKPAVDITPGKGFRADFGDWSVDKKSFFVSSNERDPKNFDIYVYDAETLARKMVFKNEGGVLPTAIDPNLRWIAVDKPADNADSNIYLIDTKKKKPKPVLLTKHKGKAQHGASHFSKDGKTLYYSTNEHSEWNQIWAYDIATRKHTEVVKADWDVLFFEDSETDKYRTVLINEEASRFPAYPPAPSTWRPSHPATPRWCSPSPPTARRGTSTSTTSPPGRSNSSARPSIRPSTPQNSSPPKSCASRATMV
jgi:hypothetical protein